MWLLLRRQHKSPFYPNLLPILLISLTSFITIPISQPPPPAPNPLCVGQSSFYFGVVAFFLFFFFLKQMCLGYLQKYKYFGKTYYSP